MQEIYWFPESDFLPEFCIDYNSVKFTTLVESKPIGKTKVQAFYYPGFKFSFKVCRDPLPKIITCFFPAIILGVFLTGVFEISRFDISNRLSNLSVTLLSLIAVMQESRANLPEVKEATYADCFLMCYIVMSMLPILYLLGTWDSYSG